MDIGTSEEDLWVLLVGLHSAKSLSGHLLELALVASNSRAKCCHFFRLFVSHTSHHEYDKGFGLPLSITLRDEWKL
jgi:hypothetical protein